MSNHRDHNTLGRPLETCSLSPLTGAMRDGDCRMPAGDFGRHGVCAQVTEEFLEFTRSRGNDLSTPQPSMDFRGCALVTVGAFASIAGPRPKPTVWLHRWYWRRPISMCSSAFLSSG